MLTAAAGAAEPSLLDARLETQLAMVRGLHPRDARRVRDRLRAQGRELVAPHDLPPGLERAAAESGERDFARMLAEHSATFLADHDPRFPPELLEIPDPPCWLYLRGRLELLARRPRVAIVGSRAASEPGREMAWTLARDLALVGVTVVSGLARGIDSEAHRGALHAGGCTFAVMGTGIERCYPAEHEALFLEIAERGLLLTEFPPETRPLPLHFPQRNRILAGLADVIVVVEGTEKSGARTTVDHALDQGREVMAVPRDFLLPGSALPNRLLRDGAAPARSARDIWEQLRGPSAALPVAAATPSSAASREATDATAAVEARLIAALSAGADRLEGILSAFSPEESAAVRAALLRMEIAGVVAPRSGGRLGLTRA